MTFARISPRFGGCEFFRSGGFQPPRSTLTIEARMLEAAATRDQHHNHSLLQDVERARRGWTTNEHGAPLAEQSRLLL